MTEGEIREALRRAAPVDAAVRERSRSVISAAFASGARAHRRSSWLPVAIATALLALTGVGVATARSPDAGVSRWVRDLLGVGQTAAKPALMRIPGHGRVLAAAGTSMWIVAADGAKRRLGIYSGASWSPRGRFLIAWRGGSLSAIDPRGDVRWSLPRRAAITSARWSPVDGYRIAYVAEDALRIVNGHGRARRDVAPSWRPDAGHVVAYVDGRHRVAVVAVDARRRLWRTAPVGGVVDLDWSPDGRRLSVLTDRRLLLFDRAGRRRSARAVPAELSARAADWAPGGERMAVVGDHRASGRSGVLLIDSERAPLPTPALSGPGRLGSPVWSPDGRRLLVSWPHADQWLFLTAGRGRSAAVADMTSQFPAGRRRRAFPDAVEWCCRVARPSVARP